MRLLCHESQNTADVGTCNLASLKSLKVSGPGLSGYYFEVRDFGSTDVGGEFRVGAFGLGDAWRLSESLSRVWRRYVGGCWAWPGSE